MVCRVRADEQEGQNTPSVEGKTRVELRFNKVAGGAGGHHAYVYVYVEGPDGKVFAVRAGPEQNKLGFNYGKLEVV